MHASPHISLRSSWVQCQVCFQTQSSVPTIASGIWTNSMGYGEEMHISFLNMQIHHSVPPRSSQNNSLQRPNNFHSTCVQQFPNCTDENAISVACLDLHYYVNVHSRFKEKEEKYTHSPITLNDLKPESELTAASPTKSLDIEGTYEIHHTFYVYEVISLPLVSTQRVHKTRGKLVCSPFT